MDSIETLSFNPETLNAPDLATQSTVYNPMADLIMNVAAEADGPMVEGVDGNDVNPELFDLIENAKNVADNPDDEEFMAVLQTSYDTIRNNGDMELLARAAAELMTMACTHDHLAGIANTAINDILSVNDHANEDGHDHLEDNHSDTETDSECTAKCASKTTGGKCDCGHNSN